VLQDPHHRQALRGHRNPVVAQSFDKSFHQLILK
jgi:hypothetical protein